MFCCTTYRSVAKSLYCNTLPLHRVILLTSERPAAPVRLMSSRSPHPYDNDKDDRHKKIKLASASNDIHVGHSRESAVLKSGVFWDIENIPVKKAQAARRVPDIKLAMTNFVRNVNHYNAEKPQNKSIEKFLAVARQKGRDTMPTTAEIVKKQLVDNQVINLIEAFRRCTVHII